jgi:hypothetical protein
MRIGFNDDKWLLLAWNNEDGTRSVTIYIEGWPITCTEQKDEIPENNEIWTAMFTTNFRHLSEEEIRTHEEQRRM